MEKICVYQKIVVPLQSENKNNTTMETVTLTITEPRRLAEVIKANMKLPFLWIAEGKLFVRQSGGSLIIYFEGTPDGDDAVNAYADALVYELQRIGVEPVIFTD